MGEYQYYEFQAVDRPLSPEDMAAVRRLSSRARITSTLFQNVYNWGDFRGDPLELMTRYYDAHVYVANWGVRRLMLRLPRAALDPAVAEPYLVEGCLELHSTGDYVILEFQAVGVDEGAWIEDEEAQAWMPALLPLRAELAAGDLRSLYLGWLSCLSEDTEWETTNQEQEEGCEEEVTEPPVPPGLKDLSASLSALVDFLGVDPDLVAAAAERSADLPQQPSHDELERWVLALPQPEKDRLLVQALRGHSSLLQAVLSRRLSESQARTAVRSDANRTAAELLASARALAEARRQAEEARQAAARAAYLAELAPRENQLWTEVEELINQRQATAYDRAVAILRDLQDLAASTGTQDKYRDRVADLRTRYARRRSFISRLDAIAPEE